MSKTYLLKDRQDGSYIFAILKTIDGVDVQKLINEISDTFDEDFGDISLVDYVIKELQKRDMLVSVRKEFGELFI